MPLPPARRLLAPALLAIGLAAWVGPLGAQRGPDAPADDPAPAEAPDFSFATNETLCVLHFLHTATGGEHASPTYRHYVDTALAGDAAFAALAARYAALDLDAGYRRAGLPRRRYRSRSVMDLLWLRATSAHSLDDFSERAFGLLPAAQHAELFAVLAAAQPYYRRLVWDRERVAIARAERFLDGYEARVGALFGRVADFYGTPWPASLPFTVALCPIPLASGTTSAVPKASTLVCSYLTGDPDGHRATLGVAVHEMCHSLYDEQPARLQQDLDDWFALSPSPYATYAYAYFNEALATAIGNGWAYERLNGYPDGGEWYADPVIDGFARALLPRASSYLAAGRALDRPFVEAAVEAFAKTFPEAYRDVDVLMHAVGIYADTEDDATLEALSGELFARFRIGSSYLRAPLASGGAVRSMGYPQLTKVFVVDRDRAGNWALLQSTFADVEGLAAPADANVAYAFYDEASRSPVLVLLVEDAAGLGAVLDQLRRDRLLDFGAFVSVGAARAGE